MRHLALGLCAVVQAFSRAALRGGAAVRRFRSFGSDPLIDDLIRANAPRSAERLRHAKPVDWAALNRLGERRWQETLRAQRRQAVEIREFPRRVWAKGE